MGRPRRFDQTSAVLRQEIEDGRFSGTSMLPGERQLASLLQVSRTTLRRALADLIEEGLLRQRHGMGTFINQPMEEAIKIPVKIPLVYYGLNGRIDHAVELARGCSGPDMDEVMTFGIDPRDDVFRLSRVTFVRGKPDAVEYASAPLRHLPDPSSIGGSLPAAVSAGGFPPAKKLQRLRQTTLSDVDAAHLDAPPHAPAIGLHEAYFLADGACCLVNRAVYLAAGFDAVFSVAVPKRTEA